MSENIKLNQCVTAVTATDTYILNIVEQARRNVECLNNIKDSQNLRDKVKGAIEKNIATMNKVNDLIA